MPSTEYHIGPLFPRKENGEPNLVVSDSLKAIKKDGRDIVKGRKNIVSESLNTQLRITSNPIKIPGTDSFINEWLIPQLTDTENKESLFNQMKDSVVGGWDKHPRYENMYNLSQIGYRGPGYKNTSKNNNYWNTNGSLDDKYYREISKIENYKPELRWENYSNTTEISSDFDKNALLQNIDSADGGHADHHHHTNHDDEHLEQDNPNHWMPSILYTYKIPGESTSYPGPVMMLEPGEELSIDFSNNIEIPGLTEEEIQKATLVTNSMPGPTGGAGHGGATTTNYHLHGAHVHPGGFADNVVSRYTTGQNWTTKIDIPGDHGMGSYWYHPHYHPAVNQQLYGGASGFLQIGDPLGKVPGFSSVPRNLAIIKGINVIPNQKSGDLSLTGYDFLGQATQAVAMPTVNGSFQPSVDVNEPGWQALTLSNQDNGAYYNIRLIHTDDSGNQSNLPLYIYGEDGHQYPQIRKAIGALGKADDNSATPFSKSDNLIALPPGKRVDLLTYLPKGRTEIGSVYSFLKNNVKYNITNYDVVGGYPDLTSKNQGATDGTGGPGPLAIFNVQGSGNLPSTKKLDQTISKANKRIDVQKITPLTTEEQYDGEKIPSVNLFTKDWQPLRKRKFDWTIATLVGPVEERDAATQAAIAEYDAANPDSPYQRYQLLPTVPANEAWLGAYPGPPFLINDHVFPNGNLIIAQLGTMEEWKLRNWSTTFGGSIKYVGHPFHIHINDYQVKNSDTALGNKRNLEDVTSLNSSGYSYKEFNPETKTWEKVSSEPLDGDLHTIKEANSEDEDLFKTLSTYGANDQTVRMLFQDYLGTYVMHCHMIPHEDAGMMQVITVVENTDSSWLIPVEDLKIENGRIKAYQARTFEPISIDVGEDHSTVVRAQVGDVTADYVQDVILSSNSKNKSGTVQIIDGQSLKEGVTNQLISFSPHKGKHAPWAFLEDFNGDGLRDLLTTGFNQDQKESTDLEKLEVKAWESPPDAESWEEVFKFKPFETVSYIDNQNKENSVSPVSNLDMKQLSVAIADANLDNFQDIAIAYAVKQGVRLVILDGAALALTNQTENVEDGYLPDENMLADVIIKDDHLQNANQIVVSSGFNSYAQSALENIVLTSSTGNNSFKYTLQLQAGHFIATSEPDSDASNSKEDSATTVHNNNPDLFPISLADKQRLPHSSFAASPVISGSLANGALLVDDHLAIAQGNSANGNKSTGNKIFNTAQQLLIDLDQVNKVNGKDLEGIIGSNLDSKYSQKKSHQRLNMTNLAYYSYVGETMSPADAADMSATILGKGGNPKDLVDEFLSDKLISKRITKTYGAAFDDLSVADIISDTVSILFGRSAKDGEIQNWQSAVNDGLAPQYLPISILQAASKKDQYRIAMLSSASQWNQLQWGTGAALEGSFGQGMQPDKKRFSRLNDQLASVGIIPSWSTSNQELTDYIENSADVFNDGNSSKTGFF